MQYLVEFFYPTDQVRVTWGVFKENIICNNKYNMWHIVSHYCRTSLCDKGKNYEDVHYCVCIVMEKDYLINKESQILVFYVSSQIKYNRIAYVPVKQIKADSFKPITSFLKTVKPLLHCCVEFDEHI